MPSPIRIGLAGYGLGGRYFHAPLIASAPDCEFLGVVTTSPERRRQVAAGATSEGQLAHRGAEALADRLGTPVVEFPGDHGGFVVLPQQCAQVLNQALTQTT